MQSFSSRSLGSHREVKTGKSLIPSKETIREVLIKSIQVGQGRAEVNSRWGQSGRLHGENGNWVGVLWRWVSLKVDSRTLPSEWGPEMYNYGVGPQDVCLWEQEQMVWLRTLINWGKTTCLMEMDRGMFKIVKNWKRMASTDQNGYWVVNNPHGHTVGDKLNTMLNILEKMSAFTYPASFILFGNCALLLCFRDSLILLWFYIVLVGPTPPLYLQTWTHDEVWSSQLECNSDWYKDGHITQAGSVRILPSTFVGTLGKKEAVFH